ncbi:MAG: hypothetical protein QOF66_75 [Mycobacterium sp.]|jgi:hypothetical protein|nr:hypothetical protein [Mycobacterium sp.]
MATHKKSPTSWIKLEWFALRMPFLHNGWRKRAPTSRIGSSIMASTTTSSARPRVRSTAPQKLSSAAPQFKHCFGDIVRARFPEGPAELGLIGSALRIIAGPRGEGDAFWFHYDASVVTMVVPISCQMPNAVTRANWWACLTSDLFGVSFLPTSSTKSSGEAGCIAVTSCAGSTAPTTCK